MNRIIIRLIIKNIIFYPKMQQILNDNKELFFLVEIQLIIIKIGKNFYSKNNNFNNNQ